MSHEPEILDSTALMLFKECPRKYYYKMVQGYDTKVTFPYFAFGSAYHKFREVLEEEYLERGDSNLDECIGPAVKAALDYWQEHGTEAPVGTKWDFLNSERLLKSLGVAANHWKKEKHEGKVKVLASEQTFILALPSGRMTGGRADQIIRYGGRVWGRDFKTSSAMGDYYERSLEPNDQFTRYTWAEAQLSGEKVQGQVVEVLYNSKREGPKIITYMTSRTEWQIDNWLAEQEYWYKQLEYCRDNNIWPMNEKSCRFCQFHAVCKLPSESSQQYHLKSNFQVKPWNFLKPEGDE